MNTQKTEKMNTEKNFTDKSFVIKGDIFYTPSRNELSCNTSSYLVVENGYVSGVFKDLPESFTTLPLYDFSGMLILPGFSDLHTHAPQYVYRGIGMDMELLDWLDQLTFPQEAKYADVDYAERAYSFFVNDLTHSVTTRASIFATLHVPATIKLMEMLEETGLKTVVGKDNMNRNSADYLCETTESSLRATEDWIKAVQGRFSNTAPIITPRFIPTCTDDLMYGLAELAGKYNVPVQSHLNENLSEIELVKKLCPYAKGYADAYRVQGFISKDLPCIMAHCVHMEDYEIEMLKDAGTFIAHSPQSNTNIRSGVAPVTKLLDAGVKIGLATDVAGGVDLDMMRSVADAIRASKLRWRLQDTEIRALTMVEAFYLATKAGGEFFGKVGSFEPGYEADIVVIDDSRNATTVSFTPEQRLERAFYLSGSRDLTAKFVAGRRITL